MNCLLVERSLTLQHRFDCTIKNYNTLIQNTYVVMVQFINISFLSIIWFYLHYYYYYYYHHHHHHRLHHLHHPNLLLKYRIFSCEFNFVQAKAEILPK